jgi:aminoglycoside phosphotransferase (APT) family kinase protein
VVPAWVAERVQAEEWRPIGGGYTRAPKWLARSRDGTNVFVKAAEDDELALRPLRTEIAVLEAVEGPFLPRLHDALVADDRALAVLEDLSGAVWPPPYPSDVRPLFEALADVAAARPPAVLRGLEPREETRWRQIEREPEPLLALGVCSERWLADALPLLIEAESRVPLAGDSLVHYDVWSDNLCFAERGAVLVDWAEARIGNPAIDVAFALLSLRVEGAALPPVEDEPALAAFVTGVVATEAAAPPPAWAVDRSTLREDQRSDLRAALPWTASVLGLPPP